MKGYDVLLTNAGLASGIAALFTAVFYNIYAAMGFGAACAALYALRFRKGADGRIDRDIPVFVEGMSSEIKAGHTLAVSAGRASTPGLSFSREMNKALATYRLSLNPYYSFEGIMGMRSEKLRALAALISSAIAAGAPASGFMRELGIREGGMHGIMHKADAALDGSVLVSSIGSVIFFPMFAGISAGILGVFSPNAGVGIGRVMLVFAFFIVVSNYYSLDGTGRGMAVHFKFVLAALAGILIMRIVSLVSISMV